MRSFCSPDCRDPLMLSKGWSVRDATHEPCHQPRQGWACITQKGRVVQKHPSFVCGLFIVDIPNQQELNGLLLHPVKEAGLDGTGHGSGPILQFPHLRGHKHSVRGI